MPPPESQTALPRAPTIIEPDRRSIRLPGYDYSRPGPYFVTLCVHGRANLFGTVEEGAVLLNDLGRVVQEEWLRSAELRPGIALDQFVIMPNHLHGILVLKGERGEFAQRSRGFGQPISGSLSTVIGQFKAGATSRINTLRGTPGARVWQRNFFETIIRNERALQETRQYIAQNPSSWETDPEA